MPLLLLKELPQYECLLEAAKIFPELDPSATEAFLTLLRTGDEAFRVTDENLGGHGLSQGRFGVLMKLAPKPSCCGAPRTPAELADLCGVTRATMTGLIDTLERDGLVVREPSPEDRRMMLVRLTDKGTARVGALLPEHFRLMAALMAGLSEAERKTLVRLLTKILNAATHLGPKSDVSTRA